MRRSWLVAALAILVVGCSAPASTVVPPGGTLAPTATAGAPAPSASAVAPTIPAEFSDPDPALVDAFMAQGLTELEAIFLALTQTTVQDLGPLSQRVTHLFPTGNTAEYLVTLTPDVVRDPDTTEPTATVTDEPNGDFSFSLVYFLPYDAMPPDVAQEIQEAAGSPPLALTGAFSGLVAAEKAGVEVVAGGVVKAYQSSQISSFLKYIDSKLGSNKAFEKIYKGIKAELSVKDSLALKEEFDAIDAEIDRLKDCAENPTDPITKQTYRNDPAYKQQILERIEAGREEIKGNTAVMFVAVANSLVASYAASTYKIKWLGYVVGPATAWSKEALKQLNEKLLDELKRSVAKCVAGYRIEKVVSASQLNVSVTITYSGIKCGGLGGEWVIDSAGTLTGYGGTANIGGPVVVRIDEETLAGTVEGTANLSGPTGNTQGRFTGNARITPQPPELELTITGGSGNGYNFGFLDTGFLGPGTLTLPIEQLGEDEECGERG